jgi:hypothetical protein
VIRHNPVLPSRDRAASVARMGKPPLPDARAGGREHRVRRPSTDQLDTRPDVLVARVAAEQWGVLSVEELRQCGLSRDGIAVRVRNGQLHPMHRGVYAVGHDNPPLAGRFLAAVKACGPRAVLSHYSAAALWGIVAWDGGTQR